MQSKQNDQFQEYRFQVKIIIEEISPNTNGSYNEQVFLFSGRPETGDWLMSAYWKVAKLINKGLFKL